MAEHLTIDTNTWVDEYADMLYAYAYTRVSDDDLAKDLVQDTFVSALKALDGFEGKSSVKTWLVSILKRKIIDHWRKQASRKTQPVSKYFTDSGLSGQWLDHFKPGNGLNDVEASLENEELKLALIECIGNLPDKWKGIVIDKLVEERDTDEVCKEHDITPSNLWVIIHRAKMQLRACLESKWMNA